MYNSSHDFTFAIVKPNAVKAGNTGPILAMINKAGFEITAMRMVKLTRAQASSFYDIHRGEEFFIPLIDYMTSGPVVVMILQHQTGNSVGRFRELMGPTDPSEAPEGTIRKLFAESPRMNAIHGADSKMNAEKESNFFFSGIERFYST